MNFGVPSQRKVKQEAYPNNAIVTVGIDGGKGKSRQIIFNKRACELMGITDDSRIAFAFSDDAFAVANTEQVGMNAKDGIRVTKSKPRKISDKKTYGYLTKLLKLDTNVENLFEIQQTTKDTGGLLVYDALPYVEGVVTFKDCGGSAFASAVVDTDVDRSADTVADTIKSAHSITD